MRPILMKLFTLPAPPDVAAPARTQRSLRPHQIAKHRQHGLTLTGGSSPPLVPPSCALRTQHSSQHGSVSQEGPGSGGHLSCFIIEFRSWIACCIR